MTPDLFEEGAQRLAGQLPKTHNFESGGRNASYGRVHQPGSLDVTHGRILYLEDVNVSFDGFKAMDLGGSATQSVVLMAIVIVLTVVQFRFVEKKVNY